MMLADATNEFMGQWVVVAIAVIGAIGIILAIAAYFATSRELGSVVSSLDSLTKTLADQNRENEKRAKEIHDRINPLGERVSNTEGKIDAFEMSFEKFTRMIESNSRANNETITAFTRSLDTFARVLDKESRKGPQ